MGNFAFFLIIVENESSLSYLSNMDASLSMDQWLIWNWYNTRNGSIHSFNAGLHCTRSYFSSSVGSELSQTYLYLQACWFYFPNSWTLYYLQWINEYVKNNISNKGTEYHVWIDDEFAWGIWILFWLNPVCNSEVHCVFGKCAYKGSQKYSRIVFLTFCCSWIWMVLL